MSADRLNSLWMQVKEWQARKQERIEAHQEEMRVIEGAISVLKREIAMAEKEGEPGKDKSPGEQQATLFTQHTPTSIAPYVRTILKGKPLPASDIRRRLKKDFNIVVRPQTVYRCLHHEHAERKPIKPGSKQSVFGFPEEP